MKQYFTLFVMFSIIPYHGADNSTIAMTPRDVVNSVQIILGSLNAAGRITALVCWDFDYTVRFTQEFNANSKFKLWALVVKRIKFDWIWTEVPDRHHEVFIVDTGCDKVQLKNVFNQTKTHLERNSKWVLLNVHDSKRIHEDVEQCLSDQHISLRSSVSYIWKVYNQHFEYHQLYRIKINSLLIHYKYGTYRDGVFRKISNMSDFEDRRNLRGTQLLAGTVLNSIGSIERFRNYSHPEIDSYMKCVLWLHTEIMQYANGSIIFQDSGNFGNFNDTANIASGLLGDIGNGKVDIAGSSCFITSQRTWFFQFIGSVHVPQVHFVFRRPTLSNTNNIFMLPFDEWVWTCTILMILVFVVLLTSVVFVELRNVSREIQMDDAATLRPQIGESWIVLFGATCQQGSAAVPRTPVARMLMVLSFISLMFLFTSYSANITVLLQSPSNKIKTIPQLMESGFVMAIHNNSWNNLYFKHRGDPMGRAVYNTKITNSDGSQNIIGEQKGMQSVRNGRYALHLEDSTAYHEVSLTFQEYEKCLLQKIRYVPEIPPYVAMKKNSPYLEVIKVGLLRVQELGVYGRHKQRYFAHTPSCNGDSKMFVSASILDTLPAFEILVFGLAAAVVVCFIEILYHRFKGRIFTQLKHFQWID